MSPTPFINPSSIATIFPAARFVDISTLLNIITPILVIGAALLFLITIARSAYLIISAGDNAEQITQAKQTAVYAVVGIVLVITAYLIIKLIGYITGVDIPI